MEVEKEANDGSGGRLSLLLLFELKNAGLFSNALSLLCISTLTMLRVFLFSVLSGSLFPRSSSFNNNPTIEFCGSKVEMPLNTKLSGLSLLSGLTFA